MTKSKKLAAIFAGIACVVGGYAAVDYTHTRSTVKDKLENGFAKYMPDRSHHPFIKCLVEESTPGITEKEYARRYQAIHNGVTDETTRIQNRYVSVFGTYAGKVVTTPEDLRKPTAPAPAPETTWRDSVSDVLRIPVVVMNQAARAAEDAVKKAGEPYWDVLKHSGTCYDRHGAPVTPRDLVTVLTLIL